MQHASRQHAKYGASSAYRWMICLGSTNLVASAPAQESSPDAKEGTAAHEILDHALTNKFWYAVDAWVDMGCPSEHFRGELHPHIEAVQFALDYVRDILELFDDAVLYVEEPFHFPSNVDPDNTWGTCDIAIWIPSINMFHVIDYKHGAGTPVEVEDNKQLLYYSTGFVYKETVFPLVDDGTTIVCTIIQPRCAHRNGAARTWPTNLARLTAFIDEVDAAIVGSMNPNAPLLAGKQQCKWCPASILCPAREAQAVQVVKSNFRTVREVAANGLPDVKTMPLDRIVAVLQSEKIIKDWLKEVKTVAYNYMLGGGAIPGFKIVEALARRRWYDANGNDENTAAALMRLINTDDWDAVYPRQLISITEAETKVKNAFRAIAPRGQKKHAAELANKALAALTLKVTSGNLTIAEASDYRPEYNRAAVNFQGVNPVPSLDTDAA